MKTKRRKPTASECHYLLKGPWEKKRAKFSMQQVVTAPNGKRLTSSINPPELLELNRRFHAGEVTLEAGRVELEAIRKKLQETAAEARRGELHVDNVHLAERFIKSKVAIKVDILPSSQNSEVNAVWSALRLFGQSPLAHASQQAINARLNAIPREGTFKHHRKILRALLRFLGQHDKAEAIRSRKFPKKVPAYLTRGQVNQIIAAIRPEDLESFPMLPELIRICYNLGTRIGEAIALERSSVQKQDGVVKVWVGRQYTVPANADREGNRNRATKNRTERFVVPLNRDELLRDLAAWLKRHPDIEDRNRYRWKVSKVIHSLCQQLFQLKNDSPISEAEFFELDQIPEAEEQREYRAVHMLRAGHAKAVIDLTGNEVFAANQIGDTPQVLREHYAGKVNSQAAQAAFVKLLEQQKQAQL